MNGSVFVSLFFAICVVSSGFCRGPSCQLRYTHVGRGCTHVDLDRPDLAGVARKAAGLVRDLAGPVNPNEPSVDAQTDGGERSYICVPALHGAVIHHTKWPSPSGPVEPHPERLASEMLPSPERATSDASAGEGVAETRAAEVTSARMVEKRMGIKDVLVVKAKVVCVR